MQLQGITALVTGANRGLGYHLVRALLAAGASKIYAAARNPEQLNDTVALDPERVLPVRLDLTDKAQIAALAQKAEDIQLLVNNAGVLDFGGALETTDEVIDRNMSVNFYGTFDMSRAFAPVIEKNGGGSVVNVLTFLSFVSAPIFSAYNASKAASWSMAMSLRPYLAPKKVSIINAFPTTIDTEMVSGLEKVKDTPADVADDIIKDIINGNEDIFPLGAKNTFQAWRQDQKAVEEQFAKLM
ncbi:MAG: SDR family NAD(P)-dependent oxidoreductase [Deltaproteobacteria bacterium]|nr:SDR family NAD(P)-dependent oxidoreductase [Deltaproteobacteria bacterium]